MIGKRSVIGGVPFCVGPYSPGRGPIHYRHNFSVPACGCPEWTCSPASYPGLSRRSIMSPALLIPNCGWALGTIRYWPETKDTLREDMSLSIRAGIPAATCVPLETAL
jgi:hypothetical protein